MIDDRPKRFVAIVELSRHANVLRTLPGKLPGDAWLSPGDGTCRDVLRRIAICKSPELVAGVAPAGRYEGSAMFKVAATTAGGKCELSQVAGRGVCGRREIRVAVRQFKKCVFGFCADGDRLALRRFVRRLAIGLRRRLDNDVRIRATHTERAHAGDFATGGWPIGDVSQNFDG